ncbi:transmembrane and ubiquitin-like domain-containing protein 1 [Condylostylus longicornis]|uniref:transmembrane and ubiquitin-like domain-containing protein 1 n=1 Tax=Condylostylus longicornis TaxID=2530218 RepID=UPI00244DCE04|nr:transmembrane and ubiquitin-like domain-containing protein 1 [Condylostylus longicornis]XP_055377477.1 transmembrane and ubiquitin-like domain-containing protein 1 [Condylostylus longicornis]XP_055377478.1 transmembrane and ubiquitin-like domain-containing protein 1 [Condylostylus longicornis]
MIFEGLDIEFVNIFIAIAAIIIVYFAWKSTNVRDLPTAVLIIENNRRRLLENITRPQTTIPESISDTRNPSVNQRTEILNNIEVPAPSLHDVLDEVSDLALSSGSRISSSSTGTNSEILEDNDTGPQEIIQNMDSTIDEPHSSEGIRRRRLAFYSQENQTESNSNENVIRRENLNLNTSGDSTHAENCSNENNENENISKSELSRNQNDQLDGLVQTVNTANNQNKSDDEFRIKLKYLNDDLRLVKGNPQEALGDFKKRHFMVELAAEKLVRLVFNGHVLQPDTKTLQAFGLFDNCVVHCLVHKKPMQTNQMEGSNIQQEHHDNQNNNNNNNNNAQPRTRTSNGINFRSGLTNGPLFVYFAVGITSLAIVFCWYCRFQYSYLFSLYSTIGLIFMTALFLLIFPLVILIEWDATV